MKQQEFNERLREAFLQVGEANIEAIINLTRDNDYVGSGYVVKRIFSLLEMIAKPMIKVEELCDSCQEKNRFDCKMNRQCLGDFAEQGSVKECAGYRKEEVDEFTERNELRDKYLETVYKDRETIDAKEKESLVMLEEKNKKIAELKDIILMQEGKLKECIEKELSIDKNNTVDWEWVAKQFAKELDEKAIHSVDWDKETEYSYARNEIAQIVGMERKELFDE